MTDPLTGNVGGNTEFHKHVDETAVDSRTGEGGSGQLRSLLDLRIKGDNPLSETGM